MWIECTLPSRAPHSALLGGIMYSAPALCIPYDSFLWPLLPILGEFLHSAPASCIGTLSALSWLWVSFCIPHSASCILHVSHSCSFGPASAICILHLHPASGAMIVRQSSHAVPSASCILHSACCTYRVNILGWVLHSASAHSAFSEKYTECRISGVVKNIRTKKRRREEPAEDAVT